MKDYIGLVDTLNMKGMVVLERGGGALLSRTYPSNKIDVKDCAFKFPLYTTEYKMGKETPELVRTQSWNGAIQVHTSKAFTAEYGYDLFMNIPPWIYYNHTNLKSQTKKQIKTASETKIMLQIKVPSIKSLFLSNSFNDWLSSGTTKENTNQPDKLLWDYILHHHDFRVYGIKPWGKSNYLHYRDLPITQMDLHIDIRGIETKDVLGLTSVAGYYARKNMAIWHNTDATENEKVVIYQSPNGIEFRKGKKSSEIYKFYDKKLQQQQQYYDAIYTPQSFASDRYKKAMKPFFEKLTDAERTTLRYEVSLRKVPSQRNAVNKVYAKYSDGIEKDIHLDDIIGNTTIYSRVASKVLQVGLYNIFGSEITKEISNLESGDNAMNDTDILQKYKSKGLKYLGIKYLMKNEGLNNEQVWKYLTNAIAGNSSYEVVRRLRNEFRDEGLALDLLDTHQQTLDRLKDVYKNALS